MVSFGQFPINPKGSHVASQRTNKNDYSKGSRRKVKRSTKAVYRLIWSGALPAYKLGPRTIRLTPMDVGRFAAAEKAQGR